LGGFLSIGSFFGAFLEAPRRAEEHGLFFVYPSHSSPPVPIEKVK
jgi:hypothetical protein